MEQDQPQPLIANCPGLIDPNTRRSSFAEGRRFFVAPHFSPAHNEGNKNKRTSCRPKAANSTTGTTGFFAHCHAFASRHKLGALKMDNFCPKVGDFHRKSPHFSFSSLKKNLHHDDCRAKKLMPTEKTGEHFPFAPTPSHHITPQEESSSKICIHRAFRPAKQPENHKMMESKAPATAENDYRIAQNAQKVGSTYRKQPTSDECVEVSYLTPSERFRKTSPLDTLQTK